MYTDDLPEKQDKGLEIKVNKNPKDDQGDDEELEDLEITPEYAPTVKEQIININIRMQEIDSLLERYENTLYTSGEEILTEDEVIALKEEYKQIKTERKILLRQGKKNAWDNFPVPMWVYAVFQIIFSFIFILQNLSANFAEWALKLFEKWDISFLQPSMTLLIVMYFFIPFLSLLTSLIILLSLKDKTHKKIFAYIYIIQGIETIITVTIMILAVLK